MSEQAPPPADLIIEAIQAALGNAGAMAPVQGTPSAAPQKEQAPDPAVPGIAEARVNFKGFYERFSACLARESANPGVGGMYATGSDGPSMTSTGRFEGTITCLLSISYLGTFDVIVACNQSSSGAWAPETFTVRQRTKLSIPDNLQVDKRDPVEAATETAKATLDVVAGKCK